MSKIYNIWFPQNSCTSNLVLIIKFPYSSSQVSDLSVCLWWSNSRTCKIITSKHVTYRIGKDVNLSLRFENVLLGINDQLIEGMHTCSNDRIIAFPKNSSIIDDNFDMTLKITRIIPSVWKNQSFDNCHFTINFKTAKLFWNWSLFVMLLYVWRFALCDYSQPFLRFSSTTCLIYHGWWSSTHPSSGKSLLSCMVPCPFYISGDIIVKTHDLLWIYIVSLMAQTIYRFNVISSPHGVQVNEVLSIYTISFLVQ